MSRPIALNIAFPEQHAAARRAHAGTMQSATVQIRVAQGISLALVTLGLAELGFSWARSGHFPGGGLAALLGANACTGFQVGVQRDRIQTAHEVHDEAMISLEHQFGLKPGTLDRFTTVRSPLAKDAESPAAD